MTPRREPATDDSDKARLSGIAAALGALSTVLTHQPRARFRGMLRSRLLVAAARPSGVGSDRPWRPAELSGRHRVPQGRQGHPRMVVGVAMFALASVVAVSTVSTVRALPGYPFYEVKQATQSAATLIDTSEWARGQRHLNLAATRLTEISRLIEGDSTHAARAITATLRDMDSRTRAGNAALTQAYHRSSDIRPLNVLDAFARDQRVQLSATLPALPAEARPAARESLRLVDDVGARALALLDASCQTSSQLHLKRGASRRLARFRPRADKSSDLDHGLDVRGEPAKKRAVVGRLGNMRRFLRRPDGGKAVLAGEAAAAAAAAAAAVEETRRLQPVPTAAAFFDIDNTIMRGSSIYHFARGMAAHNAFTARDLVRFAWQQAVFRIRGTENADHMHAAREAALAFVAGKRVDELRSLGERIYDELVADRIWPGTRALAQQHLDAGQRVWLVTATPVEMASIMAGRLGFTGALGTVAERIDGRYSGRLVGELLHGPAKAEAVRALAQREGLDLARCSAYSDSVNDLPMLSLVGHPGVVNPDPDLREHAKERGWPCYDFRTGRKVTLIALPVAAGVGAVAGGIAVGVALSRRRILRHLRILRRS